jgi:AsmA protein
MRSRANRRFFCIFVSIGKDLIWRTMRKLGIVVAIAIAAIVALVVVGAMLVDVNRYRPRIQNELQAKLGRRVSLGELHLHLVPFSIKADGLSIAESPAYPSAQPFATAQEVYVSAGLLSLIHGSPEVDAVTLSRPRIELMRSAAGIWNFSSLGSTAAANPAISLKPVQASAVQASDSANSSETGLTLKKLVVTGGQVAVTDLKTGSPRTVYNNIDATLSNYAPGQPFYLDASIHFPGQGKELASFHGRVGPLAPNAPITPINGQISIEEVALAGLNSITAGSIPPNTDAVATGHAMVSSIGSLLGAQGTLHLANAVIQGKKVDLPIDTQYDLKIDRATDQISIASSTVKIGTTAVAVAGSMNGSTTPSTLNLNLSTVNASIAELARLAALFGASNHEAANGTVSANLNITGTTKTPAVQGAITAPNVQAEGFALSNVKSNLAMSNGVLTLNPLTANIFEGAETGTVTVDTKPAQPQCSVRLHFSGVDTNALLSAISTAKNTLYGQLTADTDGSFAIVDSANLARTLNGTLNFNVVNGRLANVNILNELAKVGKFLNAAPAQQSGNSTPLQKFAGTLAIQNGVANTSNLVAVLPEGSLTGAGTINLLNQALNLHVNAVMASSFSKAVGGNVVGGYLNTALANKNGELVLPVIVTGTMAHPAFQPDVQAIAKMKLGDPTNVVQGALNGLLGGQNQKGGQKQQNPLGDLLKGLGKKK